MGILRHTGDPQDSMNLLDPSSPDSVERFWDQLQDVAVTVATQVVLESPVITRSAVRKVVMEWFTTVIRNQIQVYRQSIADPKEAEQAIVQYTANMTGVICYLIRKTECLLHESTTYSLKIVA